MVFFLDKKLIINQLRSLLIQNVHSYPTRPTMAN